MELPSYNKDSYVSLLESDKLNKNYVDIDYYVVNNKISYVENSNDLVYNNIYNNVIIPDGKTLNIESLKYIINLLEEEITDSEVNIKFKLSDINNMKLNNISNENYLVHEETEEELDSTNDYFKYNTDYFKRGIAITISVLQVISLLLIILQSETPAESKLTERAKFLATFSIIPLIALYSAFNFVAQLNEGTLRWFTLKRFGINQETLERNSVNILSVLMLQLAILAVTVALVLFPFLYFPIFFHALWKKDYEWSSKLWILFVDLWLLSVSSIVTAASVAFQSSYLDMLFNFAGISIIMTFDKVGLSVFESIKAIDVIEIKYKDEGFAEKQEKVDSTIMDEVRGALSLFIFMILYFIILAFMYNWIVISRQF